MKTQIKKVIEWLKDNLTAKPYIHIGVVNELNKKGVKPFF